MDVRRAALNCIEQNLVDEAYDGRVFDVVALDVFFLGLLARDVEALEVEIVVSAEVTEGCIDGLDGAIDTFLELVLFDDDRVDSKRRLELDFVDRRQVGRVGLRKASGRGAPAAARGAW